MVAVISILAPRIAMCDDRAGDDPKVRIVAGTKYISALARTRVVAASMVLLLHARQNVADGSWRMFEPG